MPVATYIYINNYLQSDRVVKSVVFVSNRAWFKTYMRHFVVSLLKNTYRHSPLLGGLGKQF